MPQIKKCTSPTFLTFLAVILKLVLFSIHNMIYKTIKDTLNTSYSREYADEKGKIKMSFTKIHAHLGMLIRKIHVLGMSDNRFFEP